MKVGHRQAHHSKNPGFERDRGFCFISLKSPRSRHPPNRVCTGRPRFSSRPPEDFSLDRTPRVPSGHSSPTSRCHDGCGRFPGVRVRNCLCALPEDRLHQLQRLPVPAPVPPAAASVPFSAKSARNPRLCEAGRNGGKDSKMRGIRQNRKPHIIK